jgi:hypothetical protein
MGKVRGTFEEFTGHVTTTKEPTDCSATATISMSSVNTANRMRDDDLRSVDFFDVDRHPDMTFESTGLIVHGGLLELDGAGPRYRSAPTTDPDLQRTLGHPVARQDRLHQSSDMRSAVDPTARVPPGRQLSSTCGMTGRCCRCLNGSWLLCLS